MNTSSCFSMDSTHHYRTYKGAETKHDKMTIFSKVISVLCNHTNAINHFSLSILNKPFPVSDKNLELWLKNMVLLIAKLTDTKQSLKVHFKFNKLYLI